MGDSGRFSAGSGSTGTGGGVHQSSLAAPCPTENDQHDCHDLNRPITRSDIEYIAGNEHITQNWLQMGWLMLNHPMSDLRNEIMKDYLTASNRAKVIHLIELWQKTKRDKATARALVDICCDKIVCGVRYVLENSLTYGPDCHGDSRRLVHSAATRDYYLESVIRAVAETGKVDWLSIGLELGYSIAEITDATTDLSSYYHKLMAIIQRKIKEIGKEETAQTLLEICKVLPTPIYGEVMDELKTEVGKTELDEDAEVTAKQIVQLAKAIGSEWHDIGVQLGFTLEELDRIKQQQKSYDDCLVQLLKKWRDREHDAKIGVLMEACKKAKVAAAATKALLNM